MRWKYGNKHANGYAENLFREWRPRRSNFGYCLTEARVKTFAVSRKQMGAFKMRQSGNQKITVPLKWQRTFCYFGRYKGHRLCSNYEARVSRTSGKLRDKKPFLQIQRIILEELKKYAMHWQLHAVRWMNLSKKNLEKAAFNHRHWTEWGLFKRCDRLWSWQAKRFRSAIARGRYH